MRVSSQALQGGIKIATRLLVVLLEFKHSSRVSEVIVQRGAERRTERAPLTLRCDEKESAQYVHPCCEAGCGACP